MSTTEVYQRVIARFTELIEGLEPEDWAASTPCEGWTVRDLVRHVVERDERVAATVGGPTPEPLPEGTDLVGRWHERVRWWADRLADPEQRAAVHSTPLGEFTFEQAAARFMIGELTVHTWDLARATGRSEGLDPEAVRIAYANMRAADEGLLRRSGNMAPPTQIPANSDEQSQFLAFTGRAP
ncbi:TIGR03086 family metal-binding protein [Blastococcus sp. CT_GayMR16]|uniref:TIGR03086 family metal-binding protein n=1 Tax=Blastococcus sp. CT_GayMR16 TaxID=2559607 RepID=UPI00143096D3|nr:TIGR03086 family metal-binding protein [Blastococcus sp. CT_GayMR16]